MPWPFFRPLAGADLHVRFLIEKGQPYTCRLTVIESLNHVELLQRATRQESEENMRMKLADCNKYMMYKHVKVSF